ncbi:hypothetical protein DPMN_169048 [Dreissena polymorpha]|uniref:Ubiquitin-like protease family profile domain-containing protein n=1 Tax=Dreissena polymorpha TaxID=45954 RepID=A0A9D4F1W3_DREPO|nr:hypothetical protein DPMN_169048 [Dreissena polymorpha]
MLLKSDAYKCFRSLSRNRTTTEADQLMEDTAEFGREELWCREVEETSVESKTFSIMDSKLQWPKASGAYVMVLCPPCVRPSVPACIRVGNNHWVLLVASVMSRTVTIYDSLGGNNKALFDLFCQFMCQRAQIVKDGLEKFSSEFKAPPCNKQRHGNSCGVFALMNSVAFHRMPWNSIECRGIPWNAVEFHGMPWNSMERRGIPWNAVEFHGMPWNSIECRGIPWKAME